MSFHMDRGRNYGHLGEGEGVVGVVLEVTDNVDVQKQ